jgi:hypothetical protein
MHTAEMPYIIRKLVTCITVPATASVEIEEAGNLFVSLNEQNYNKPSNAIV